MVPTLPHNDGKDKRSKTNFADTGSAPEISSFTVNLCI
ncbi:hypothetical protein JCM19233_2732 [Vibrio astriarenae]|nr:hypothetical protein JCM19233_2732 [Vibrio sp. C7]